MRLFTYIFLLLTFVSPLAFPYGGAQAQQCLEMHIELSSDENEIVVTAYKSLSTKKEDKRLELEEQLRRDLSERMSEKIMTRVNSGSMSAVREENGRLNQYFYSETSITSGITLGYLSFDFCFDQEQKLLYGRCVVRKRELAASISADCISRLAALNGEIKAKQQAAARLTVKPLKEKYVSISSDFRTALYLNNAISTDRWDQLVTEYNKQMAVLESSQTQVTFDLIYSAAKDSLNARRYYSALLLFKQLDVLYRDNAEVKSALKQTIESYGNAVEVNVPLLCETKQYELALQTIDVYCAEIACDEKFVQLRRKVREDYFNDALNELKLSMRYGEEARVDQTILIIDRLKEVDTKAYLDAHEDYLSFKRTRGKERAREEMSFGNYTRAISLLNDLEYKYGSRDNEVKRMREEAVHKLFRLYVRLEKKRRPHTWAMEIGAEGFSNLARMSDYDKYRTQVLTFSPTIGIYRKYRFEMSGSNRPYPVQSDLIGVRFRYVDLPTYWLLQDDSTFRQTPPSGFLAEVGLSGITLRHIHYAGGMIWRDRSTFENPSIFFGELGFRIPIGPVSLMASARATSFRNDDVYLNFMAGVFVKLDFNRKFGRRDKLQIRNNLLNYQ